MQISPANPEMQAVIQQQPVSTVQQPLQFEHVPADEVRTEVMLWMSVLAILILRNLLRGRPCHLHRSDCPVVERLPHHR